MDDPTPYPQLNGVLDELARRTSDTLGHALVGIYLQGSFALGDFDEHSDVDFITVVWEELGRRQAEALSSMHDALFDYPSAWAKHLEGSYVPAALLADPDRYGEPLWYLDHGSRVLVESDHCNTPVVRWIVRERGVCLIGPEPATLLPPVEADTLRRHMAGTIVGWGREILVDPEPYRNRFYQAFIVLNYCRMLRDLTVGRPGSKREGAEWAKAELDPAWSLLIDRSWGGRPDPARSVRERPDAADFDATLRFVAEVVRLTEESFEQFV